MLTPDPMIDTRTMAQGGVADHPLRQKLSEVYRGLKLMDHDNDGQLHPTDIVRGLGAVGLSVGTDPATTKKVNSLLMRAMQSNGMVLYAPFVYTIAADPQATVMIAEKLASKDLQRKAQEAKRLEAARLAAEKAADRGPKLRPGVTARDLRAAVSVIKDKMFDKYSGFTGAFRAMDKDGSGYISRSELNQILLTLNLNNIKPAVIETLIDFVDCTNDVADDDDAGSTDIAYREFARAFAAEDIMMLQTLPEFTAPKRGMTPPPPTPPPQSMVAEQVQSVILSKFKPEQMRQAFGFFDKDGSRTITRTEVKRILATWGTPLTDEELAELFKKCDQNGDGQIDYQEFCDIVAKTPEMTQVRELVKNPVIRKGVRPDDIRRAQHVVKEHILTKFKKLQDAFKFLDKDRTGSISRDELKVGLFELNLLSGLRDDVVENLIDFIDIDGGDIAYREFARVLTADDVMSMSPLSIGPAAAQVRKGHGFTKMTDMPGAQGLSWTMAAFQSGGAGGGV